MPITFSDKATLTFSPVRGRHYLMARGNTVIREIFYDENENGPALPISPLIPFFQQIFQFPFTWKSLMTEQEAQTRGLRPMITYQRNLTGANENLTDAVIPQKMCMVQRTVHNQHYLLDREVHPIEIDIASVDGTDVKLIFTFTIQILDMKLLLAKFPAGNFLQYAENSIVAKLRAALPKKKFDEIRGVASDDGSPIGLQDDLNQIRDALNNEEFEAKYGFKFLIIMHEDWILTPAAAERLSKIQAVETAKLDAKVIVTNAQATADARKVTGETEIAIETKKKTSVGNAQTAVMKKRTQEVGDEEVKILTKKIAAITPLQTLMNTNAATVSSNLKDLKGTLITDKGGIGGGSHLIEMLIANSIQNQQNSADDTE